MRENAHYISPSKPSLITAATIPTLSICLTSCSALVPRSSLLLLSLSKVTRVVGCYLVVVGCVRACGGQVSVFKLTRLALTGTIREYKGKHRILSGAIVLLTMEMFLMLALNLVILLLSYDTPQPLYPHNILHTDVLILSYYSGLGVAATLGAVAACRVVGEMSRPLRVPVLVKTVSLVMVVGEAVMTVSLTGDRGFKWRESAVVFLSRNCLMTALIQGFELIVIIFLNRRLLNRVKRSARVVLTEENEVWRGMELRVHENVQLRLNREDSVELLRALDLNNSSFLCDEGIRVLLSNSNSRKRQNSLLSIVTV